jgi:hypothetical protein
MIVCSGLPGRRVVPQGGGDAGSPEARFHRNVEVQRATGGRPGLRTALAARDPRVPRKSDVFDRATAAFAERYSAYTVRDHETLLGSITDGRLPGGDVI